MKVLLVDDSEVMRRILKNSFQNIGYETFEAEDATDALDFLAGNTVDLVMLDINLPDIKGLECLKKIRQQENLKQVKVIMCTSDSESSSVLAAVKSGANSYVVKPFTFDQIQAKLKEIGLES